MICVGGWCFLFPDWSSKWMGVNGVGARWQSFWWPLWNWSRTLTLHRASWLRWLPIASGPRPEAFVWPMWSHRIWAHLSLWSLGSVIPAPSYKRFQPHMVFFQVFKAAMIPSYSGLCTCGSLRLEYSPWTPQTGPASGYLASWLLTLLCHNAWSLFGFPPKRSQDQDFGGDPSTSGERVVQGNGKARQTSRVLTSELLLWATGPRSPGDTLRDPLE